MAKIIAVVNQKGGVGKTTITINLGIGLANAGKKVLLIDFDPQGSLTDCMGFPEPDLMDVTVAKALMNSINDVQMDKGYGILRHEEGVDVLPGNIDLSGLEVSFANVRGREHVLKNYLAHIKDDYDYILIDCAASLGVLTINAFVAANSVIIPTRAEKPSIRGLQQLLRTIGKVRKSMNPEMKIEGVVPNMVDVRTNYAKDIVKLLTEAYGGPLKVFDSIPQSVRMAETSAAGKSIFAYDAKGKAAEAYAKLIGEVLS